MSITLVLVLSISAASLLAFQNSGIFEKLQFNPFLTETRREWYRFFSCAWVHGDFIHLGVNMYVLWVFGPIVEDLYGYFFEGIGGLGFFLLFFLSVIAANVSTFFRHRNHPAYNSVGASGGVAGVIFAFIVFEPLARLYIFGLIPIPGVLFGILYLGYSHFEAKRGRGNINHEAHFYGAVFGFLFTLAYQPTLIFYFWDRLKPAFSF